MTNLLNITHTSLITLLTSMTKAVLEATAQGKKIIAGCTFASLYTITPQNKLNKGAGKNSMINVLGIDPTKIMKHSRYTGIVSLGKVSYRNFVENKLVKCFNALEMEYINDMDYEVVIGDRLWGDYLKECPAIVDYNETKYLVVYCHSNNKPQVYYTYDGEVIDIKDTKFDKYRKPASAKTYKIKIGDDIHKIKIKTGIMYFDNVQVSDPIEEEKCKKLISPIEVRNPKLVNIKEIIIDKVSYNLIPDTE